MMPRLVQVNPSSSVPEVTLPNGATYTAVTQVTLQDAQWAEVTATTISKGLVTDLGNAPPPGAQAAPGAWQTITMSGAGNVGVYGGFGTFRCRLEGDLIRLDGSLVCGTAGTIGTLPGGLHPAHSQYVTAWTTATTLLQFNTSGTVTSYAPANFVLMGSPTLTTV